MLAKNIIVVFTLSALSLAQDVDNNDIPSQCTAVCSDVVSLSRTCDQQNDDNDTGYRNCVCNANNANTQIPLCEACVSQFDNDRNDNDVNDLLRACAFSTTSYNPSATASVTQISGTNVPSSLASSLSSVLATGGTATVTQSGGSQTTNPAQQSTGAAAVLGAPVEVGLGMLGVALGML
ncbi:hypothetical protein K469DRAFT_752581 [Zopfia rhizophila CBS 207.26]|uniref:GPI anchored protein n=1 Tax=Zopfia rhizophila CBS 207.26 TaxID=1314779 RepID=A0A6A6DU47_9PEZI|nr:hypothetical protein K469DRAFT_752581 [Zopfia rhizophila CBS 207.26]